MTASITYCGHSTAIITTQAGKKIIIDPWLKGNPKCPEDLHDPGHIDYICLTHGHSDHTASAVELALKTNATVFATFELAMLMIKDGVPSSQVQPMNKGGTVQLPDTQNLSISLTNAFHSSSYDAKDGNTYYAGEACGVVITLENGKSIYHAGDTCLFEDMKVIKKLYRPHVCLLPIGDRFTMGPEQAAKAVEWLEPEIVIPIHHSTFELLTGRPEDFKKLASETDSRVEILNPGETLNL